MTLKEVLKELKRLQKETGKHPALFTKALVISKTKIKDWDLRKLGGLSGIVKANFPMGDKELADMRELKDTASYINKLERELGQKKLFEQKALEMISAIKPIKRIAPYKPKSKGKIKRELNLVLSDTHYGIEVHPEAVNEVNTYNWTVAARRTAMVVDETIKYKRDKRDEVTQLNVFIIGDIIGGLIHGTNYRELDLLIHQQNGALHTLAHALSLLIPNFPKIKVICLSGNHDDNVTKRSGGRVVTEKFDSFINHTYY